MDKRLLKSILLGTAVGDALGFPVQFLDREYVRRNPVVGMACVGCGDVREAFAHTQEVIRGLLRREGFHGERVHFERLVNETFERFRAIPEEEIRSTGYVIDTLEASLWSLFNHDNFKDTLLAAVNLGHDADTVGAVTGAMAGIVYGWKAIPAEWIEGLARKDDIIALAD